MHTARVLEKRSEIKAWLARILQQKGWTATQWARAADISPSTLNRFLNDPNATHLLRQDTLDRLADAASVEPPARYAEPSPGLAESEASPFVAQSVPESRAQQIATAAAALGADAVGHDLWQLNTRALELSGILPGDFAVIDLDPRPKAGDIVIAQLYDWASGTAETVVRLYEPPFLVAASLDPRYRKPELVDPDRVTIKATVEAVFRIHDR